MELNWNRVRDTEPKFLERVLIIGDSGVVELAQYRGSHFVVHNEQTNSKEVEYGVTHWMRLPEKP